MSVAKEFPKEKLIIGVMAVDESLLPMVEKRLISLFGAIDITSPSYSFSSFSPYYDGEMEGEVKRVWWSFEELVEPTRLADIKLLTNSLESEWSRTEGRNINLDPALLNTGRMNFATCKNAAHRIPLDKGVYGELSLFYARKDWHGFMWTYPDLLSPLVKTFLSSAHKKYLEQRK